MKKMNREIKARWIAELRSGQFKQGQKKLRNVRDEFCCLGVLCNLHAQAHPRMAAKEHDPHEYLGCDALPHWKVMSWARLDVDAPVTINGLSRTLYEHNDRGATFAEIADAIEEQL